MRKIIVAVIAVLVSFTFASASELSTKTASQFVGSGGAVLVNSAVQQTNLFIPLANGFYADVWNSLSLDGDDKEIDWTAGWSGSVVALNMNIGASYFDCGELFHSTGDIINPYAETSKTFELFESQTLTPSVKIEAPILVGTNSVTGIFTHIGIKHAWQATDRLSVVQTAKIVHDSGAYGMDRGFIGSYTASIGVAATKSVTLNTSVAVSTPLGSIHDRSTEVTPSVEIAMKF